MKQNLKLSESQKAKVDAIYAVSLKAQNELGIYLGAIAEERGIDMTRYMFNIETKEFSEKPKVEADA